MIRRIFKSAIRIGLVIGIWILMMPTVILPTYSTLISDRGLSNKVKDKINPLRDWQFNRYCSSSVVKYKGKKYTVTNRHCCNAYEKQFKEGYRLVGTSFQKILKSDRENDICVLTASKKAEYLRLAKNPAKTYQKVFIFGYPKGHIKTPRFGHVLSKNYRVCITYKKDYVGCEDAILTSTLVFPGNSGSPLLNMRGKLVGVIYGGNFALGYGIAVKLENVKRVLEDVHSENK